MKDERREKKKKKPEGYIDLFADDEEEEESPLASLFSDDEEEEEAQADAPEEAEAKVGMEPAYEEPAEPADDLEPAPQPSSRETFSFDRYGRRTGKVPAKRRKERYGKRKHAKKATTTLLLNETEARREREEAQKRAS